MPDRRPNTRRIRRSQAIGGLYIDFEGRTDEDPVLLGLLYRPDPGAPWIIRQFVTDPGMRAVDLEAGATCEAGDLAVVAAEVIELSDDLRQPIVSWSEHDRHILTRVSGGRAFRYRNAIQTARRWRTRQRTARMIEDDGSAPNSLQHYESLIGYDRPAERHEVGNSIAYIRRLQSVTPGALDRWNTILDHNQHDLLAMRTVTFSVLGLEPPA